ncbi:hypothetical protein KUH03_30960 [Sphingobacterium sp. E70]|uniref:hypothetical protein n=1 Tax=Sphingobacterium sp. E70 TaxID=2853439 RepID=UPI00211CFE0D|nr:hypothetical protein [Sphingobacterium sp. E70]ULT23557.1 hypothetical protein KUH03_30960 [Sphingobacterium sp. E70]
MEQEAGHVMDLMKSEHDNHLNFKVMRTLLKKLNLGAIIALVGVVGLTASWKNHESKKLAPQWYSVTITDTSDPNNAANQQIGSTIPEPTTGECATLRVYLRC